MTFTCPIKCTFQTRIWTKNLLRFELLFRSEISECYLPLYCSLLRISIFNSHIIWSEIVVQLYVEIHSCKVYLLIGRTAVYTFLNSISKSLGTKLQYIITLRCHNFLHSIIRFFLLFLTYFWLVFVE